LGIPDRAHGAFAAGFHVVRALGMPGTRRGARRDNHGNTSKTAHRLRPVEYLVVR
jgi:hypothetical protein